MTTVQVRVSGAKGEPDLVDGPDDALVVVRVAINDTGLDPTVAFMTGKLKAEGNTGVLFDALARGEIAAALGRLCSAA